MILLKICGGHFAKAQSPQYSYLITENKKAIRKVGNINWYFHKTLKKNTA